MFRSTKVFLIKVHEAFDELGYHPDSDKIYFSDFQKSAVKTLNHTKELEDSINAVRMYQFIGNNFDKICTKIKKYFSFWKTIPYEGNELLGIVSDEESQGTYFISNAFDSDFKKVFVVGHSSSEDYVIGICYKHGKFYFNDLFPNYYLRFSKMSSTKMVIVDESGDKKCVVSLNSDFNVFLENNKTNYEIVLYETGMGIYEKSYIDSLKGNNPEVEKINAFIEWDILEEKSEYGLARLEVYKVEVDLELFLLIATSCFLLYRAYVKNDNSAIVISSFMYSSWARNI